MPFDKPSSIQIGACASRRAESGNAGVEGEFSEDQMRGFSKVRVICRRRGRRGVVVPSGSASRKTSWVTGAVSPSPKRRKRNRYTIGLPSVHPK